MAKTTKVESEAKEKPKRQESASDQIQRELAASALAKRKRGETPTAREQSALRKVEQEREEATRWQYYESIPKRHWKEMSGRSIKVINEQADRYNLPLRGKTIDLVQFAKAFHDFLAANKYALAADKNPDDPLLVGDTDSPGLERYRLAKAEHAELDLAERRGELLNVERGRQWVFRIMSRIRQFGDRLRSHPELQVEFSEMLDDCKRLIETMDDHQ